MKEGFGNRIQGKIEKRVDRIADKMGSRFKNIQPFDTERVSPEQQLYDYEQLKPQDMMNFVRQYGVESADKFVFEMEQLKRRQKNA
uniref:Uncharacterized protein n=1 Tax=viral metagenome TaxID=1070528 RepID=A0A6M3XXF7_9ZZZZ